MKGPGACLLRCIVQGVCHLVYFPLHLDHWAAEHETEERATIKSLQDARPFAIQVVEIKTRLCDRHAPVEQKAGEVGYDCVRSVEGT